MTTTLRVTTTRDQFDGRRDNGFSLREAIQVANNNPNNEYEIILESGKRYNLTISTFLNDNQNNEFGDLDIDNDVNVHIRTDGAEKAIIDASRLQYRDRVFGIGFDNIVVFENLVITGGKSHPGGGI